jgi:hypothetical protein
MKTNRSLGETKMELPWFVVSNAKMLVEAGIKLPALIPNSANFYVATENDETVIAFSGIEICGVLYKIGTKI